MVKVAILLLVFLLPINVFARSNEDDLVYNVLYKTSSDLARAIKKIKQENPNEDFGLALMPAVFAAIESKNLLKFEILIKNGGRVPNYSYLHYSENILQKFPKPVTSKVLEDYEEQMYEKDVISGELREGDCATGDPEEIITKLDKNFFEVVIKYQREWCTYRDCEGQGSPFSTYLANHNKTVFKKYCTRININKNFNVECKDYLPLLNFLSKNFQNTSSLLYAQSKENINTLKNQLKIMGYTYALSDTLSSSLPFPNLFSAILNFGRAFSIKKDLLKKGEIKLVFARAYLHALYVDYFERYKNAFQKELAILRKNIGNYSKDDIKEKILFMINCSQAADECFFSASYFLKVNINKDVMKNILITLKDSTLKKILNVSIEKGSSAITNKLSKELQNISTEYFRNKSAIVTKLSAVKDINEDMISLAVEENIFKNKKVSSIEIYELLFNDEIFKKIHLSISTMYVNIINKYNLNSQEDDYSVEKSIKEHYLKNFEEEYNKL